MSSYVCRCLWRSLRPQAKRMQYIYVTHYRPLTNSMRHQHCLATSVQKKRTDTCTHRKSGYSGLRSHANKGIRTHFTNNMSVMMRYRLTGWINSVRLGVAEVLAEKKDIFLEKMKECAVSEKQVTSRELLSFIGISEKEHFPYVFKLYKMMRSKHLTTDDVRIMDLNMISLLHFHDAVTEANAFIEYLISEVKSGGYIESHKNSHHALSMIYMMLLYKNKEYQQILDIAPRLSNVLCIDICETGVYYVLSLCSLDTPEAFKTVYEFVMEHFKGSLPKVSLLKNQVGMMALKHDEPRLCLQVLDNCYNEVTIQLRAVATARLGDFNYAMVMLEESDCWIGMDTLKDLLKSVLQHGDRDPETKKAIVLNIEHYLNKERPQKAQYFTLQNYLQIQTNFLAYSPCYSATEYFR